MVPPDQQPKRPVASRNAWRVVAIVLGVALALTGLAIAGYLVLMMWALASFGSNK